MHLLHVTTNEEGGVRPFRKFPLLDLRPSICRGVRGQATTVFLRKLAGIGKVLFAAVVDFWRSTSFTFSLSAVAEHHIL